MRGFPPIGPIVNHGAGWGGFIVHAIVLAIIFFIVFAIVFGILRLIMRAIIGPRRRYWMHGYGMQSDNAFNIAKERYAKGEITEEEFNKIKNNLS